MLTKAYLRAFNDDLAPHLRETARNALLRVSRTLHGLGICVASTARARPGKPKQATYRTN